MKGEREQSRRTEDLDAEYRCKDLCRRFIADTKGIIDIQPLCLRPGCSKCEFLLSIKWKRDGTIRKNGRLVARPWIPRIRQFIWLEKFERGVLARFVRERERGFARKRDFAMEIELKERESKERGSKGRESKGRESNFIGQPEDENDEAFGSSIGFPTDRRPCDARRAIY